MSQAYQRIIIAVDLTRDSEAVVARAVEIANDAETILLHVIEPLTFAYGGDIPMDLSEVQDQLQTQAKERLAALAEQFAIAKQNCQVVVGQTANEIHRLAEENASNLIIVGSHGRSGLALLLGSTSNGVLHGASCDVLAVRVPPS